MTGREKCGVLKLATIMWKEKIEDRLVYAYQRLYDSAGQSYGSSLIKVLGKTSPSRWLWSYLTEFRCESVKEVNLGWGKA